jgi:hypothetical protein
MTDFETAMLTFLQDAQNEFNSEQEVEHFIKKHAPRLIEAARKQLMAEISMANGIDAIDFSNKRKNKKYY